jgi:hypothetical protein
VHPNFFSWAARLGRKELVGELIEKSANTQVRDNWGRMPLQIALRQAYIKSEYARSASLRLK